MKNKSIRRKARKKNNPFYELCRGALFIKETGTPPNFCCLALKPRQANYWNKKKKPKRQSFFKVA